MRLNREFIKKRVPEIQFLHDYIPSNLDVFSFSFDTRTIKENEIFIALPGKQVDGHNFLKEALDKGASGLFIAHDKRAFLKKLDQEQLKKKIVMVALDPQQSIIDLATDWRMQFEYPVIGITGSVGKTSTKEIISTILEADNKPYLASWGNQNTLLGASITILKMSIDHHIALFEMGISRRGEMAKLAALIKPTAAIITNVGHCHMEGLGSIIDIAAEKREIFKFFKEDSIGIINGDFPLLANVAYTHPVIKFGLKTTNQIQARKIAIENNAIHFVLKLYGEKYHINLKKNHTGAVFNALAATAIAHLLKIPVDSIVKAIEMPLSIAGHFVEYALKSGNGTVIDDTYNANPESMKAALLAFERIKTKAQKIVILGDMLELGVNSAFWHRQIGRFLRKTPSLRNVILVGNQVVWTKKTLPVGLKVEHVTTWQEAQEKLVDNAHKESLNEIMILIKGSLGMELKKLVQALT